MIFCVTRGRQGKVEFVSNSSLTVLIRVSGRKLALTWKERKLLEGRSNQRLNSSDTDVNISGVFFFLSFIPERQGNES